MFLNWKTPYTYPIIFIALAISSFILLSCCKCVISLFVGLCIVFTTFTKDMELELKYLKRTIKSLEISRDSKTSFNFIHTRKVMSYFLCKTKISNFFIHQLFHLPDAPVNSPKSIQPLSRPIIYGA